MGDKTQRMKERLRDEIKDGKYQGRYLIHSDSKINGGVYLGAGPREAIVIEFEKDKELINMYNDSKKKAEEFLIIYNECKPRSPAEINSAHEGKLNKIFSEIYDENLNINQIRNVSTSLVTQNGVIHPTVFILAAVYVIVKKRLKPDNSAVINLIEKNGWDNDVKVYLGNFIKEGIGVCRHDSLACAAIIERFLENNVFKFLKGNVSVDRNSQALGGHGWCRYSDLH